MLDDLGTSILVVICIALFALLILSWLALNHLAWKYRHAVRAPTGNFKMILSQEDWDKGVKANAFAVGVQDAQSGAVMMTVLIEREKDKVS